MLHVPKAARAAPATILQVLPELNEGGVERGAIEIAEAIVSAGGRALVASAGGRLERALEAVGAESRRLDLATKNPLRLMRNGDALARLIRAEGVNIIHARSRGPAWSAQRAARRAGVAFVTTYHGVYNEDLPLKRRYNRIMAAGDRVIAISQYVAEHIRQRHPIEAERLRVIPRGADLSRFAPERVGAAQVRALLKLWSARAPELDMRFAAAETDHSHRPVVMLPGRLTTWKGQLAFIDAMARLEKEGAPVRAILVGGEKGAGDLSGGPFESEIRRRIAEHGLERSVLLAGPTADMPTALSLADIVVSASLEPEAFGRVAVEAQAMGKPVVATAHGGAVETVEDGVTGRLVAPGDVRALASGVRSLLALSPGARSALGDAGRARVARLFSTQQMCAATLSVYEELLGRPVGAVARRAGIAT